MLEVRDGRYKREQGKGMDAVKHTADPGLS